MKGLFLTAFSVIEPDDKFYRYYPSWLNAWESHLYNRALKATHAQAWFFKRFGCSSELYAREMIRKPAYIRYLEAMEQAADNALQQLAAKQRQRLIKSRTAFIYVDAWGEAGLFENITSALHVAMIDTLPKNLLKKFAIKHFTCKVRGERQAFMQALRMAQDYLSWDLFDFVVICGAYRAIPLLVFSEAESASQPGNQERKANISVERVGCFIFSQREGLLKVNCGKYLLSSKRMPETRLGEEEADITKVMVAGLHHDSAYPQPANTFSRFTPDIIRLDEKYGDSGCISPALSWVYFEQHAASAEKMRTIMPDMFGGYHYFDSEYN